MKIQELIMIRSFLLHLKSRSKKEQFKKVTKKYLKLMTKKELLEIIEMMTCHTLGTKDKLFNDYTKKELLHFIKDEYYVLDYLIQRLETEVGI